MPNNADYGLSLQKYICDKYNLEINEYAMGQFQANYNPEYEGEYESLVPEIFNKIEDKPKRLLTYTQYLTKNRQTTSPHNFELFSGKTLSIRTTKNSDKVAPRTVGQAGYQVLNEYFGDIYGSIIEDKHDIKKLVYENIHEMMLIFIDCLFQSDYTILFSRQKIDEIQLIKADELSGYSFAREDFSFTKSLEEWKESTTLKYKGKSIAEIQIHKNRTFKFRFIISSIPEWFHQIKETTETFGISAEAAICDYFSLDKPLSFKTRALPTYIENLMPVIRDSFKNMPPAVKHSGALPGERGKQSKSSYDFVLEGNETLSLKTNKGKMVCPPEVGQPGSDTCLLYFGKFMTPGIIKVTPDEFKKMVYEKIDLLMPIYIEHLFDSNWLLWIRKRNAQYIHTEINRNDIKKFIWEKNRFSFTKATIEEWNESNTVKYDGVTIGEFQIHRNRNCFKFRFNLENLLSIIKN